jgi:hypothetical protein
MSLKPMAILRAAFTGHGPRYIVQFASICRGSVMRPTWIRRRASRRSAALPTSSVRKLLTVRAGCASFLLGVAFAITSCEAPIRSAEWELMRNQPIHDASPPGSTQLGRSTHPPRKVFVPGMGDNEGWFETVYASPLPPAQTLGWYAERFMERYRMSDNSRDGRFVLQGSLAVDMPIVITVQISESRPQYGNILGRFPDGPPGTQSYVFIWTATH